MRKRIAACMAAIAAAVAFLVPGAAADPVPPDATWSEAYIRSGDGTRLHADVFRPKGLSADARTPVILIVSPYIGIGNLYGDVLSRPQILDYYVDLFGGAFQRGYSIVQVSLRGQGASDGCPDLGGPGEQADARAAVRWSATRPWSTGRVGGWGLSWDGYMEIANLAAGTPGFDAAVIEAPVTDLYRGHYMNGVPYVRGKIAQGWYYHGLAAVPPLPSEGDYLRGLAETLTAAGDPECAAEILDHVRQSGVVDPNTTFWKQRDLIAAAARSTVPTLWSQGFVDEQVYDDQFLPVWENLRGPHRAWFGQYPHVVASEAENGHPETVGRSGFTAEAFRWLDRYLKGGPNDPPPSDPAVEVQEGSMGLWRSEAAWPPDDASRVTLPVRPGPFLDGPGSEAEPYCRRLELHCLPGVPGVLGDWTLTQPLPYPVHLAGVPRLSVDVTTRAPGVHLVALLYDVAPGNQTTLVSRGAQLLPHRASYQFDLYPQDWRFGSGHRIALFITGADDDWFVAGRTLSVANVESGGLSLPFLRNWRRFDLEGGPSATVEQRSSFPFPETFAQAWTVPAPLPPPMAGSP